MDRRMQAAGITQGLINSETAWSLCSKLHAVFLLFIDYIALGLIYAVRGNNTADA